MRASKLAESVHHQASLGSPLFNTIWLRECLHDCVGGILSLDHCLIEKTGEKIDGVSYLYDYSKKKNILCHDIASTFYRSSTE